MPSQGFICLGGGDDPFITTATGVWQGCEIECAEDEVSRRIWAAYYSVSAARYWGPTPTTAGSGTASGPARGAVPSHVLASSRQVGLICHWVHYKPPYPSLVICERIFFFTSAQGYSLQNWSTRNILLYIGWSPNLCQLIFFGAGPYVQLDIPYN